MFSYKCLIFTLILSILNELKATETEKKFNGVSGVKWTNMEQALNGELVKPIFVLIQKSWCKACQNLKDSLAESLKFKELSELFYMISYEDEEETKEKSYTPDGNYIPRIFFLNSAGGPRHDIYNENGNPDYKYFYSNADQVVHSMEKAIEIFYTNEENGDEITDYENLEDDYESGFDEELSLDDEDESAILHEDL
ncbi:thioredoxin domain-containing 12 [Brachionus plicatilis]|uniref:Thioredoxin domain-containing 12 n=1 Tax=Brachionus plicatilis TaxID=10195 RepID=A0A3M7PST4_BRAPC|nr:thioredoxin domain-containing 12 [Brachionus plicatilis]